jgi:hypothetical protein
MEFAQAIAVIASAFLGERERDEIIVATMFDESCIPFRKSNTSARAISTIRVVSIKYRSG